MEQKKWQVSYLDKYDDLTNVWVYADSKEDAIREVKHEYWDVERTLQVIATTPLQAQLLKEAGLPEGTADMRWNRRATMFGRMILEPLAPSDPIIRYEGIPEHPADFVPAWSLGNLMRIAGAVPNLPDRPDLVISGLVGYICEQLSDSI